jgi:hypothetical protein
MPARARAGAAPRVSIATGLLVVSGSVVLTALLVEAALRIAGFEYHLMPAVQFGWPDPQTIQTTYADAGTKSLKYTQRQP